MGGMSDRLDIRDGILTHLLRSGPLLPVPLLVDEQCVVVIGESCGRERPGTIESGARNKHTRDQVSCLVLQERPGSGGGSYVPVSVASSDSVCTRESDYFLVVESEYATHAIR